MYKKILLCLLITIAVIFASCKSGSDALTICEKGPYATILNESDATVFQKQYVYYSGNIVTKIIFVEEHTLKNGDYNDLADYATLVDEMFKEEMFQVKGFEYSSKLTDTGFTTTTTFNYTEIDSNKLSEKSKTYFYGKFSDAEYNVLYDKYINFLTDYGFVIKEAD